MLGYVVRSKDTPMGIARALTGDASRVVELVAANPQLRKKIIGRDMQSGKVITTFLDADFRHGVVLHLPVGWKVRTGMVGASQDYDPGNDPALIVKANECQANGGWYNYDTQVCTKYTAHDSTAYCTDPAMIKAVQKALIANGNSVGPKGADGIWGCDSQRALDESGYSFKEWGAENGWTACAGAVPYKAGCGGGNVIPPTPKKKEGEACTDSSECEAGLTCIGGKCSKDVTPKKAGGSSALWWILGGLAGAAAVVGVAVAGGAFDGDKKKGPAAR